ncbi:TPA: carbohydrate porin [Pseudomonas aeruginosa]|jgi:porin
MKMKLLLPFAFWILACTSNATSASQWGFGDWGGVRNELLENGYDFTVGYTGETATNLHGGFNHDKTARYTDQWALGAHLDLQKILGWDAADFQLMITERSGNNLSNDRIADPRTGQLSSVQEVWGRGQTWRLTQMWYRQKLFDDKLDVKLGRMGIQEDFNSFPCDFQSLAFCSSPIGNVAGDVWFSWPVSQWGMRIKYNVVPDLALQVGAFEMNPSYLETGNGFKLSGSGSKGMLLPVEAVWSPKVGGQKLPGEYRLGYFYSSASANDVYEDVNGDPQGLTGEAFKSHGSKHGWWVIAQQQLTAHNGDASRGLSIFASLTLLDQATSFIDRYQQLGLVYKGFFDSRPKDDIGFGVARLHVNDDVTKRQQQLNEVSGIEGYDDPRFVPVQRSEYNMELYYGVHLTNWLTVRPNLQYVRSPGGVDEVDNALVAGLKIQASF